MSGVQRFSAVLERDGHGLGWTVARVPFVPAKVWPRMVRLRIRGEIEGPRGSFAFRSSLFPLGEGAGLVVLVNRAMQRETGTEARMEAEFLLQADLEERAAELPEELDALLDEAEGLRAWYGALSESMRREIGRWTGDVKSEEARLRRAEQMAECMLSTMEAEVELPPQIARALRARGVAKAGWERMTASQRRGELFAVFSYRGPEAREKRIAKLCEVAAKH